MYSIISNSVMKLTSLVVVFVVCLGICTAQDRASYVSVCEYSCDHQRSLLQQRWSYTLSQKYYNFCMIKCQDNTDFTTRRTSPTTKRTTTTTTPRPTPIRTTTTTTTTTTTPFWWRTTKPTTTTRRPNPSFIRCGLNAPTNRVVGGRRSDECEFPWMVSINIAGWSCGGTIIDRWHVLSAAHCFRYKQSGQLVDPSQVRVKVGSSRLSYMTPLDVYRVDMNPNHVRFINDYDLVVVTLRQPLTFGACVQPICLPDGIPDVSEKDTCFVAGWGTQQFVSTIISPDLRKVEIPLVNQDVCKRIFNGNQNIINSLKLCAGRLVEGGVDACRGDSGGPYMCLRHGVWYQFGIVSFGVQCALPYAPGIYTRVANPAILRFIHTVMNNRD